MKKRALHIPLERRHAISALVALLLATAAYRCISETFTLTTYYPAPSGVYEQLIATGGRTEAPKNILLAKDAGNVGIGVANPQGAAGIITRIKVGQQFVVDKVVDFFTEPDTEWKSRHDIQMRVGDLILDSRREGSSWLEADSARGSNGNLGLGAKNDIFFYTENHVDPANGESYRMWINNNGDVGIGIRPDFPDPDPENVRLDVVGGAIRATGGLIVQRCSNAGPSNSVPGQLWLGGVAGAPNCP